MPNSSDPTFFFFLNGQTIPKDLLLPASLMTDHVPVFVPCPEAGRSRAQELEWQLCVPGT